MKQYLIFDLDGTLIESMGSSVDFIIKYLKDFDGFDEEKARYIFSTSAGTPLIIQIKEIFNLESNEEARDITNDIYSHLEKMDSVFFPGIPEKIKELSNNYKILLTTGNSTATAKKHLNEGGIIDFFEQIHGSDIILKGKQHLDDFKLISGDDLFFEKSIYIGDGDADRYFAKESGIDFIHIGNKKIDKFEIDSVAEIDKILNLFK